MFRSMLFLALEVTVLLCCSAYGLEITLASTPVVSPLPEAPSPANKLQPSGCCLDNMMNRPGVDGCSCVYPIEIGLLLENVSSSFINSSAKFQHELASQLELQDSQAVITAFSYISTSELNMSIFLGPLVGASFSYQEAVAIKAELDAHKVRFDSSLVGNYTLLHYELKGPPVHAPVSDVASPAPSPGPSSGTIVLGGVPGSSSIKSERKRDRINLGAIIGVGIAVLALICVAVVLFFKRCSPAKGNEEEKTSLNKDTSSTVSNAKQPPDNSESYAILTRPTSTRIFSYEDLREATNNFDGENLLGEGGFGRVYKGLLKDGTAVAIKRLTTGGHQGDKEFLVEVDMLSRLHHRHLVKLVGFFSNRDSSQQLLCYELVSNGSLESWLHGRLGVNNPLDWDTRMKIAIGAARGLAYLHEDCQPCVIHRDFKASNILLENNFQAKVSDFGLAKQAPEGHYLSTRVMGTFGYVAPEYAMTGHLLVKSDVYSFGVVLLELLSGRRPVDMAQPLGGENLVTWARPLLKDIERLYDLADPGLHDKFPREDFAQVAAIAAACVAPEANQRPTMGEVVQSLKMVQRSNEYNSTHSAERENMVDVATSPAMWQTARPTSGAFESDGSSSVFSSGPFGGLHESDTRGGPTLSEDLAEGR